MISSMQIPALIVASAKATAHPKVQSCTGKLLHKINKKYKIRPCIQTIEEEIYEILNRQV